MRITRGDDSWWIFRLDRTINTLTAPKTELVARARNFLSFLGPNVHSCETSYSASRVEIIADAFSFRPIASASIPLFAG